MPDSANINNTLNDYSLVCSNEELGNIVVDLKIFGLTTLEANICLSLLLSQKLPKSRLIRSTVQSSLRIDNAIKLLESKNIISEYMDYSPKNRRIVTYYQLEKSPRELYDYFKKKNQEIIDLMHGVFGQLSTLLKLKSLKDYPVVVENLYQLGIDKKSAEILTALEYDCYEERFGTKPSSSTRFRELFQMGWMITDRSNIIHLKKPLTEIALDYLLIKQKSFEESESDFLGFITLIEDNVNIIVENTAQDGQEYLDKRFTSSIRINYSDVFIDAIKDIVMSSSNTNTRPFDLELMVPYPQKIRVYLYKNSKPQTRTEKSSAGYRSVLYLPGQSATGVAGEFDFSNVTLVILGGYCIEKNLFIFWNSRLHKNFSFNTILEVREDKMNEAEILGYTTYNRKSHKGNERVIITTPENLKQAIVELYDIYYNELMGAEV